MSTNLQPSLLQGVKPLSSRPAKGTCSHCGQVLPKLHKHVLSVGLVSCLWKLYHARKPMRLGEMGLTNSEFANFQKLHYFDLAISLQINQTRTGKWNLTERGLLFLGNRIEIPHHVWTRDGRVVERSESKVTVKDIDEGYWWKIDYANAARVIA